MTVQPSVLVVEDDEHINYLLDFMLAREGFQIHAAKDGKQAIELVDVIAPPQLALLDVMLPYADGFQILAHIRAKPEWKDVPILMLTSKSQEKDIVRALEAGASDYVLKPFQPLELMARLRRFIKATP
ncbi:MAG: putative response regulator, CheY [Cyanobacteria bacterium RYN_339]|nr:putative response regulator, CheY [Cyanobacteria bacterium RYN_339]